MPVHARNSTVSTLPGLHDKFSPVEKFASASLLSQVNQRALIIKTNLRYLGPISIFKQHHFSARTSAYVISHIQVIFPPRDFRVEGIFHDVFIHLRRSNFRDGFYGSS